MGVNQRLCGEIQAHSGGVARASSFDVLIWLKLNDIKVEEITTIVGVATK